MTTHSGADAISPPPASIMSSSRFVMTCGCDDVAIERERIVDHSFDRKAGADPLRCRVAHGFLQRAIIQQTRQSVVHRRSVARWNDVTGLAVSIHPPDPRSEIGAHDGFSGGHRL